jgi:UDP-glucose 4-epimerase
MILITGGAGYIGSQTNKNLNKNGYSTVVFDNLSQGNLSLVKWGNFIEGDLKDINQIRSVFKKFKIKSVMHFAASSFVGESVLEPEKYYFNNVVNTLNLLKVMRENNVNKFIFSSTCSIYGDPIDIPITENHPQLPMNAYGRSKLIIEKILLDYSNAYDLKYVSLRYFNAAGADKDFEIGEMHNPETHLIPLVFDVAIGVSSSIEIYGTDYDTNDGSAIRDYIHVSDIANAHILSLNYLSDGGNSDTFNLGNGSGYSVKTIINYCEKIANTKIPVIKVNRRPGDVPILIGSSIKANNILGWSPKFNKLEDILESAWEWHKLKYRKN